jgi:hypothetical protein
MEVEEAAEMLLLLAEEEEDLRADGDVVWLRRK